MNDHASSLEPPASPEPVHAADHADPVHTAASPTTHVAEPDAAVTETPAASAVAEHSHATEHAAEGTRAEAHVAEVHVDDVHVEDVQVADVNVAEAHVWDTHVEVAHVEDAPITETHVTEAPVAQSEVASDDRPSDSHSPIDDTTALDATSAHAPDTALAEVASDQPSAEHESSSEAVAESPDAPKGPRPPKQRSDAELAALRKRAQESWQRVVAAKDSGETLEGTVIAVVKGGALVDMSGVRGFLPASQVRAPEGGTLDALIKTKLALKILDTDPGRRRAVVSNRRALEEERRNKRSDLLASLKVGERREGTVVRLADFGAFVDLGGIDGLIPMSELAPERVEKVGDVLSVGEKLMVEVLRVDEGGKKISLSRKNALPDPWRDHAALLRIGSVVQGTVVGFEPRFTVEIAPGIIGTIRDSDADPTEYAVGETMEVRVRNVDRRTRRITLVPSFGGETVAEQLPRPSNNGFAPLGVELQRALEKARRAAETSN